jgi:hypothetical protein
MHDSVGMKPRNSRLKFSNSLFGDRVKQGSVQAFLIVNTPCLGSVSCVELPRLAAQSAMRRGEQEASGSIRGFLLDSGFACLDYTKFEQWR